MGKLKKNKPALTERQARFVREYSIDGNATQAAIRAGYARGSANREGPKLLSNPVIAAMLAQKAKQAEQQVDVSRERILRELVSIAYAPIDREGVSATEKIAAINRINKMQGYEVLRHEHTGPGGSALAVQVDLSRLSDAELAAVEAAARLVSPAPVVDAGNAE
jgi:hypothetical protein